MEIITDYGVIEMQIPGMTLRDWFAGQALAGLLSDPEIGGIASTVEYAYKCADAMLKERDK